MDNPLSAKPVPLAFATEMVTDAVPVLASFTVWLPLFPIATFPKLTAAGDMLSTPGVAVPVSESVSGEFEALDVQWACVLGSMSVGNGDQWLLGGSKRLRHGTLEPSVCK